MCLWSLWGCHIGCGQISRWIVGDVNQVVQISAARVRHGRGSCVKTLAFGATLFGFVRGHTVVFVP